MNSPKKGVLLIDIEYPFLNVDCIIHSVYLRQQKHVEVRKHNGHKYVCYSNRSDLSATFTNNGFGKTLSKQLVQVSF